MPKKDSIEDKIAVIMNPQQMTLNKDHVKVLIEVVAQSSAETHLPSIDSMAHYRHLKEILEEQKDEVVAEPAKPELLSARLHYLRQTSKIDIDSASKEAKAKPAAAAGLAGLGALSAGPAAEDEPEQEALEFKKRRMSLNTSMGWNENLGAVRERHLEEEDDD